MRGGAGTDRSGVPPHIVAAGLAADVAIGVAYSVLAGRALDGIRSPARSRRSSLMTDRARERCCASTGTLGGAETTHAHPRWLEEPPIGAQQAQAHRAMTRLSDDQAGRADSASGLSGDAVA